MSDYEISQLSSLTTSPAAGILVPVLNPADTATAPADSHGSDQTMTLAQVASFAGGTFAQKSTYRVSRTGSDSNDGQSWVTAFATVNHAIAQVIANGPGGVIEVGGGGFAPYTVPDNCPSLTIRGMGCGQTYDSTNNVTAPVRVTYVSNSAAAGVGITVQGPGTFGPGGGPVPSGVVIEDMAVVGYSGSGDGIYVSKTENVVLRNLVVDSCAGFGLHFNCLYGTEIDNVQVTRCGLSSQTGYAAGGGIYLDNTAGQVNGLVFTQCSSQGNYGSNVYSKGAQDVMFDCCSLQGALANATAGTGNGMYIDNSANGRGPYTFSGTWFEDNAAYGLLLNGSNLTLSVTGCEFFGDGTQSYGIGATSSASAFVALYASNFAGHSSGYSIDNTQGGIQLNWGSCDSSDSTGFIDGFTNGTAISAAYSPRAGLGIGAMYTGVYWSVYPQPHSSSGSVAMDASIGQLNVVYLSANCTSSTLANGQPGATCTVTWVQDATGGRTYVWPTTCKFAGGTAPSDTTANSQTSVTFWWDGSHWQEISRAVAVH